MRAVARVLGYSTVDVTDVVRPMFIRAKSFIQAICTVGRARPHHFTTASVGRSDVSGASDSMAVVGAAATLSCLAELVVMCGRGVDRWHGQPASRV